MAKKNPKNNERREMVEKMRAEQARKERARSLAILGVCVVIVVALLVPAIVSLIKSNKAADQIAAKGIAKIGVSAAAASCEPIKTTVTDHNQTHIPDPTPITYKDAPPSFGPHRPSPVAFGRPFYTSDRPEVAQLVHNLEHGYVIAWYDDTAAKDSTEMTNLKAIATKFQDKQERFIAAPWHPSDGAAFPSGTHIALTRWSADPKNPSDESKQRGNWEYCGQVSGSVMSSFFNKWPNSDSPEQNLY
ncbi:MAG: hypothetical protein JWP74_1396 [Marmoricola sp.]|nr:hypothetical protein [Marmoricola sp.]